MEVKLKDVIVKIKDTLTWGDAEKIKIAKGLPDKKTVRTNESTEAVKQDMEAVKGMMKMINENNLEAKYVSVECAIIEIKKGDETIKFSREWLNDLSQNDGEKLYNAVNSISKKK
ncbi:MAG: hypothetical protein ACTSUF_07695 [Candidatus Heimdallarchaeaceae archaeon]